MAHSGFYHRSRASKCGGCPPKNGGQSQQALGRSRGGFTTKIHVAVDALGNPLRLLLTGGQVHDIRQAHALLVDFDFKGVIGDKAYDATDLITYLESLSAAVVIPSRKIHKQPRETDWYQYKERYLVECFINKIKQYRRVFTRFDKYASRFMAFLSFVSMLIWLK